MEFTLNTQSASAWNNENFLAFEDDDDDETKIAGHAGVAGVAGHGYKHEDYAIEQEFLSGDFFDDINDEYAFQAI